MAFSQNEHTINAQFNESAIGEFHNHTHNHYHLPPHLMNDLEEGLKLAAYNDSVSRRETAHLEKDVEILHSNVVSIEKKLTEFYREDGTQDSVLIENMIQESLKSQLRGYQKILEVFYEMKAEPQQHSDEQNRLIKDNIRNLEFHIAIIKYQVYGTPIEIHGACEWQTGYFYNGLSLAKRNNKYGFIDLDCNWEIEPKFDSALHSHQSFMAVRLGGRWKFIDKYQNEQKILQNEERFTDVIVEVHRINEKKWLCKSKGKWYLLDINLNISEHGFKKLKFSGHKNWLISDNDLGRALLDISDVTRIRNENTLERFDQISHFSNGYFVYRSGEVFGLLNANGEVHLPADHNFLNDVDRYGNCISQTFEADGNLVSKLLDANRKAEISPGFKKIHTANTHGLYAVESLRGKSNYLDSYGNKLLAKDARYTGVCDELGRFYSSSRKKELKFHRKNGSEIHLHGDDIEHLVDVGPTYVGSEIISKDSLIYTVKLDSLYYFVENESNIIVSSDGWDSIYYSKHSHTRIGITNNKMTLISSQGTLLNSESYTLIKETHPGIFRCKQSDGKHAIFIKDINETIALNANVIDVFSEYFIIHRDGFYGLVDHYGFEVLPATFQEIPVVNADEIYFHSSTDIDTFNLDQLSKL